MKIVKTVTFYRIILIRGRKILLADIFMDHSTYGTNDGFREVRKAKGGGERNTKYEHVHFF
jgi:hypothetical protein